MLDPFSDCSPALGANRSTKTLAEETKINAAQADSNQRMCQETAVSATTTHVKRRQLKPVIDGGLHFYVLS